MAFKGRGPEGSVYEGRRAEKTVSLWELGTLYVKKESIWKPL